MFVSGEMDLARLIYESGLFRTDGPENGRFRLKLHDKHPNAPLSPFYLDLRQAPSKTNGVWEAMNEAMDHKLNRISARGENGYVTWDHLAPIPLSGTALFAPMVMNRGTSSTMLTLRPEAKTRGGRNRIDGDFEPGGQVLIIDDLITHAESKLEAASAFEEAGLRVTDFLVLVDREQGGREQLEDRGYRLHTVMTIHEMLAYLRQFELITEDLHQEILDYLADPLGENK